MGRRTAFGVRREPLVTMEESKRDSGHHDGTLALHETLFSANLACAIGYAVLVYVSRSQGSWTPKNDLPYLFLRSAYRVDDLLRLSSISRSQ